MGFEFRLLEEGDYENTLVKWWKDWRWAEPPAKDSLPQDGLCGVMVSKDGVNICAGFIFLTNSKTAWCEYIISNFEYKEDDRGAAVEYLIDTLSVIAKEKGYKYIFTSLNNEVLIKRYERSGYLVGSKGCTEMIKIL
ncbi:MAG TPA: hypothetical protein VMV86_03210 [Methanosarcinales archaeon]|nr:hypothetical protein [Methanosarcinales archaeon]